MLYFDVQAATGPTVCSFTEGWVGSLLPFPVDNGQQWSVTTVDHSKSLADQNRALGGAEPGGQKLFIGQPFLQMELSLKPNGGWTLIMEVKIVS